ncbi:SRPBCC family protein [Cellulomonas sp. HZM]|uniref:SRPBCC family protein n=1 Tax=Cellulomonas sp. HZM TaxID=1454010 RepID=UPI00068A60C6|nr:SRPBCC family protein [Cellulomonas sp. HZM]
MPRATRTFPLDADATWDLLTDARNHARWIPLTRVDAGPAVVGARVVAVSGPSARRGGGGFVDRMEVTRADPPSARPRVAVFVKHGPVLLGEARIAVLPAGPTSAHVRWSEDVHLARVPRAVGRVLLAPFVGLMLRWALLRAARETGDATDRHA